MREIRDVEQQFVLADGRGFRLGVEGGDLLVDAADFGFDGGSVLALGLELADVFGNRFPGILELLFVGLQLAACFVTGEHVVNKLPMIAAAVFEAILDEGGVFADDADIEHGAATLAGDGGWNQREFSTEEEDLPRRRKGRRGAQRILRQKRHPKSFLCDPSRPLRLCGELLLESHLIGVSSTLRKWISAPSLWRQMAPWVVLREQPSFIRVSLTQTWILSPSQRIFITFHSPGGFSALS